MTLKLKGPSAWKYLLVYYVAVILLLVAWVISVLIPYGTKFLQSLEYSLNSGVWNLMELFTPIFWIVVYLIVVGLLRMLFAFIAYKAYVSRHIR